MEHPKYPHDLEASCPVHGFLSVGPRDKVLLDIVNHYLQRHPGVPSPLLQDQHFVVNTVSLRCDLCHNIVEPPWWTHTTTPALTDLGDRDGLWLVCDSCHELIGQPQALLERVLSFTSGVFTEETHPGYVERFTTLVHRFCAVTDGGTPEALPS